ncbi:isopenicillin N synthase family dioxygenase [Altererythrobacter sp. B11]|uniref:isopenicillin N synthase family dioxygenase n=1 Tax=Altererythrobacter sp. B11 TaxID=2060312 RepID=UPI00155838E2|nr:isopenicillin N synthase family oxygenase [Altererythrobacter sp. B11]
MRYEEAETVRVEEIPVIDFGKFLKGGAEDRAAIAAQIGEACERIGFFYIVNHGVPDAVREAVLSEARSFFARSFDEKMKSAPIEDGQWCGYVPPRGATEGTKPGGSLRPEAGKSRVSGGTLEQFNMMRVLLASDPNFGNGDPAFQRNLWPAGAPNFVETMIVNQRALLALSQELMAAFSLALGLEEDYFSRFHKSPLSTFGLNFYPAPRQDLQGGSDVGVGAHCDASTFTVLLQDDVGGLEVQEASGRWISAPYVPGAYIINIGDTMMGWTNGHFVSTLHRVVSRKPVDRYSATLFMNPDIDVTVEPHKNFITDENPAQFEPFNNEEYMKRFFVKFYDNMFKS